MSTLNLNINNTDISSNKLIKTQLNKPQITQFENTTTKHTKRDPDENHLEDSLFSESSKKFQKENQSNISDSPLYESASNLEKKLANFKISYVSFLEKESKNTNFIKNKNEIFQDLNLKAKKLIGRKQAERIFIDFAKKLSRSKIRKKNWSEDEIQLLIWIVVTILAQSVISIQEMKEKDWEVVSSLIPGKKTEQCKQKWLHLQKIHVHDAPWTNEEDQILSELINNNTVQKKWCDIALELNTRLNGKSYRQGKQCRERWNNHLDPNINRGIWTDQEDINLLNNYLQHGKKWSEIAKVIGNRTENAVKNRWKSLIKKYSTEFKKQFPKIKIPSILESAQSSEDIFLKMVNMIIKFKEETQSQQQDQTQSTTTTSNNKKKTNKNNIKRSEEKKEIKKEEKELSEKLKDLEKSEDVIVQESDIIQMPISINLNAIDSNETQQDIFLSNTSNISPNKKFLKDNKQKPKDTLVNSTQSNDESFRLYGGFRPYNSQNNIGDISNLCRSEYQYMNNNMNNIRTPTNLTFQQHIPSKQYKPFFNNHHNHIYSNIAATAPTSAINNQTNLFTGPLPPSLENSCFNTLNYEKSPSFNLNLHQICLPLGIPNFNKVPSDINPLSNINNGFSLWNDQSAKNISFQDNFKDETFSQRLNQYQQITQSQNNQLITEDTLNNNILQESITVQQDIYKQQLHFKPLNELKNIKDLIGSNLCFFNMKTNEVYYGPTYPEFTELDNNNNNNNNSQINEFFRKLKRFFNQNHQIKEECEFYRLQQTDKHDKDNYIHYSQLENYNEDRNYFIQDRVVSGSYEDIDLEQQLTTHYDHPNSIKTNNIQPNRTDVNGNLNNNNTNKQYTKNNIPDSPSCLYLLNQNYSAEISQTQSNEDKSSNNNNNTKYNFRTRKNQNNKNNNDQINVNSITGNTYKNQSKK